MTAVPREVARKRSAQVVMPGAPEPRVINGHVVRRDTAGRVLALIVTLALGLTFLGFVLSSL